MTNFPTKTYNVMLQSLLFNITPALPAGTGGTREPVGVPEPIPDITFITREVTAADHIEPEEERERLNSYIRDGIAYHQLYDLLPGSPSSTNDFIIGSIEEMLEHFSDLSETIGRIRLVSHGNDSFLFVPLFNNGSWSFGIQDDRLNAFHSSDETGIRFLISGDDPMILNSVSTIISGIRAVDDSLLEPFGIKDTGMPDPGDVELFFQLVNDYFQVEHGMLLESTYHDPDTSPDNTPEFTYEFINSTQRGHLITALDFLYEKVKSRLIGTSVGDSELTAGHLDNLKDRITSSSPMELGFLGSRNLGASVLSDLGNAMANSPRSENDLRNSIVGYTNEPLFWDYTGGFIMVLKLFYPDSLKLGPSNSIEIVSRSDLSSVPDLESYFIICSDIFFMKHGPVSIDGTDVTDAQRNTLTDGLRAIATVIRDRIVNDSSGITAAQLNMIRTNIEGLTIRQAAITGGWRPYVGIQFPDMSAAVTSMNAGFRTKIDHFRSLINSDSAIDIRGCLVGKSTDYLDKLRSFFGSTGSSPKISAPDWYQIFPAGFFFRQSNEIDDLVENGIPAENFMNDATLNDLSDEEKIFADITVSDVATSFSAWKDLIDFNPHFSFIKELFDGTTSKFDFATLEWKTWRSSGTTTGIPILRMEAERIDDIVGLSLGQIFERFRINFDISAGYAPNAVQQTQLDALQPHLLTFKSLKDTVDSAGSPDSEQLTQIFNDISTLADHITGISGMPAPSTPHLVPTVAPSSLELSDIITYIGDIQTYIENYLDDTCDTFFTAVFDPESDNGVIQHSNAEIRYFLNIGLPLLLKNSLAWHLVCMFMSASSNSQRDSQIANALRSWMRIQWTGSPAQTLAMNTTIDNVSIGTNNERNAVSRASNLTNIDPLRDSLENGVESEINPMPGFDSHIIKRPII